MAFAAETAPVLCLYPQGGGVGRSMAQSHGGSAHSCTAHCAVMIAKGAALRYHFTSVCVASQACQKSTIRGCRVWFGTPFPCSAALCVALPCGVWEGVVSRLVLCFSWVDVELERPPENLKTEHRP